MLELDVLLTEEQLVEEFRAALEQRYLPEKFFYWFPLSVMAWLDLCRNGAPYKNYSRSRALISRHAAEIAEGWGEEWMELVSLGSGQGDKDLLLLEALRAKGTALEYKPVDSSQTLLEMALGRARDAGFRSRGLKADLASSATTQALAASAGMPRLYAVLGNTVGITEPARFLQNLRGLLRRKDQVLLDGEIFSAEETMAGYENPVNRQFALAPLASLGLEEGRDGALVFGAETGAQRDGLQQVTKHFQVARRLRIPVAGRCMEFDVGEKILMSPSWKYSREAFTSAVRDVAGLQIRREFSSDDGLFVMGLAAPRAQ